MYYNININGYFVSLFALLLRLFLLVLCFFEEIKADDKLERSIVIGQTEILLSIMIGVELEHHTSKIMSVVPEQTRLSEKVGAEVLQSESVIIAFGNV